MAIDDSAMRMDKAKKEAKKGFLSRKFSEGIKTLKEDFEDRRKFRAELRQERKKGFRAEAKRQARKSGAAQAKAVGRPLGGISIGSNLRSMRDGEPKGERKKSNMEKMMGL